MASPLSAFVLTHNSERYLDRVLSQLSRVADEVIVVDSGSSDGTLAIARAQGCRVATRTFTNFYEQRNFAQSLCSHDYVLYLDSDEIMTDAMVDGMLALKNRGFTNECYRIRRDIFVFGRPVRVLFPGTSPDYHVRLYRSSLGRFGSKHRVHEILVGLDQMAADVIDFPVEHHTIADADELERKLQFYTDLAALDHADRGAAPWRLRLASWTRSPFAFIKWYVLKGGWRDGRLGLTLGHFAYRYTRLKYLKASRLARERNASAGADVNASSRARES